LSLRTLQEDLTRANLFRDVVHGELEEELDDARVSIYFGREGSEVANLSDGMENVEKSLQYMCVAFKQLLIENNQITPTAYIKLYDPKEESLKVVCCASSDSLQPDVSKREHHTSKSPSFENLKSKKRNFNFWSVERTHRRSSVQPSAVCGISTLVRLPPSRNPDSIVGMLCINFPIDVNDEILRHEEMLARWLPAIAGRMFYTYKFWKQFESKSQQTFSQLPANLEIESDDEQSESD